MVVRVQVTPQRTHSPARGQAARHRAFRGLGPAGVAHLQLPAGGPRRGRLLDAEE